MTIIDTHLHLIDRSRLSYAWLSNAPALNNDYSLDLYLGQARRLGIEGALHMEVDVDEADIERETAVVAEYMARPDGFVRGAISACRPENDDFPAFLERQLADPTVRGFRRVLHVVRDDLSTSPTFRANVKRLSGTGLPFDLCTFPHQHNTVIELVDSAPDVQFVLDHCGVPDVKGRALDPWRSTVKAFSKRANVAAKISGVVAYADADSWTVEDLRPFVEHVIDCFGWDRVVWGSDWPVVTLGGHLSEWVAATHALIAGCSESERTALLSGNARRIWRL